VRLREQLAEESEYWNRKAKQSWKEGAEFWRKKNSHDHGKDDVHRKQVKRLETELKSAQKDAKEWRAQAEELKSRLKKAEKSHDQLEQLQRRLKQAEREWDQLKRDAKAYRKASSKLETELEHSQSAHQRCMQRLHETQDALDVLKDKDVNQADCGWSAAPPADSPQRTARHIACSFVAVFAASCVFWRWLRLPAGAVLGGASAAPLQIEDVRGELACCEATTGQFRANAEEKDVLVAKLELNAVRQNSEAPDEDGASSVGSWTRVDTETSEEDALLEPPDQ
jgi:hypothetical protein